MIDPSHIESLAAVVGAGNVTAEPFDLDLYSADALTPWRAFGAEAEAAFEKTADVVVRPGSTGKVAGVVSLANQWGVPIVPYGGGTGVMGGVLPVQGGIVVDVKRLNRILSISPQDLTATVEAGVVLEDLYDAVAEHGLMPGHDPYSVPIATVGGTISTNGVGYRAAALGQWASRWWRWKSCCPPDRSYPPGRCPRTPPAPTSTICSSAPRACSASSPGPPFKVFRLPEAQVFATAAFDNFEQGFDAAGEMLALGIPPHPAGLDRGRPALAPLPAL